MGRSRRADPAIAQTRRNSTRLARTGHADPGDAQQYYESIQICRPDSAVIDWWSILLRVPQIPDRERRLKDAGQIMRARLNEQGTAMHLSSDPRNDMWWLMVLARLQHGEGLRCCCSTTTYGMTDLPLVMRGAPGAADTRGVE